MTNTYQNAILEVLVVVSTIIVADLVCRLLPGRNHKVRRETRTPGRFLGPARILVNLIGFTCLAAVTITGFGPVLTSENGLTANRLVMHVTAAPFFAIGAVLAALFWAHRNQFTAADWSGVRLPWRQTDPATSWAVVLRKVFFWVALVCAIPTVVSILLAMYPLPTPAQQQDLFLVHRVCALPLAASALLFTYFALVSWRNHDQD